MNTSLPYPATAELINQFCTFHLGVVKDVKDPEGRGRVRCECPGLLGKGKKNWTPWCEVVGTPIGSNNKGDGDEGIWWPLQHGQVVFIGFIAGDPFAYFCIPGPPCQEKEEDGTQLTPKEQKAAYKKGPREATRVRVWKSESGHSIIFDDRGGAEKLALVDWTGAGLFMSAAGKDEDEKEQDKEESKPRKGKRRGTKLVVTDSAEKPGDLLKEKVHRIGLTDLGGQGIFSVCGDESGFLAVFAKKGKEIGPSIVLDSENNTAIITAGECQWQLDGKAGLIRVTNQVIQNAAKIDVDEPIKKLVEKLGEGFKDYEA